MARRSMWAPILVAAAILATASAQPTPPVSQASRHLASGPDAVEKATLPDNCTRADIVAAIAGNPNWNSTVELVTLLNATYLLPDGTGPGTLLLPTNAAFRALRVTPQRLVDVHGGRMVSVLAYHSLLNQGVTYTVPQLLAASPIHTDLGALVSAGAGENVSLPAFVNTTAGGATVASGLYTDDVGTFRNVVRACGLALYEIDVLLRPAPISDVPDALDYFGGSVPANIATATSPGGLAAAIAAGDIEVANVPFNGTSFNGTTGGNATTGAAGGTVAGAAAAVAGRTLPLNGTGGTLSSTGPVLLAGTVTPTSGSSANKSAPALGPGLIYLNGTVQNGRGVNGTATLVRSLSEDGAQLTNATMPLEGAVINGTATDAGNLTAIPAEADANDTRQLNGTNGILSTVVAAGAFGTALAANPDGTVNTTAGSPVLLDGSVAGGTPLNETGATGSAARGNLGPGAILVNGTTDSGTGVSGTAYPVVAITPDAVVVNRGNGVNITDATLSGRAFNGSGVPVRLQAAAAAGAAGAGAAAGGSGDAESPDGSTGAAAAGGGSGTAPSPDSGAASGPTADLIDNLNSATGLAASAALPLGSAAVAALLLLAAQ